MRAKHPDRASRFPCLIAGCNSQLPRSELLHRHLRDKHKVIVSTGPDDTSDAFDVVKIGNFYYSQRALYGPIGHREPARGLALTRLNLFQQVGPNELRLFRLQTQRSLAASNNIVNFAPSFEVAGSLRLKTTALSQPGEDVPLYLLTNIWTVDDDVPANGDIAGKMGRRERKKTGPSKRVPDSAQEASDGARRKKPAVQKERLPSARYAGGSKSSTGSSDARRPSRKQSTPTPRLPSTVMRLFPADPSSSPDPLQLPAPAPDPGPALTSFPDPGPGPGPASDPSPARSSTQPHDPRHQRPIHTLYGNQMRSTRGGGVAEDERQRDSGRKATALPQQQRQQASTIQQPVSKLPNSTVPPSSPEPFLIRHRYNLFRRLFMKSGLLAVLKSKPAPAICILPTINSLVSPNQKRFESYECTQAVAKLTADGHLKALKQCIWSPKGDSKQQVIWRGLEMGEVVQLWVRGEGRRRRVEDSPGAPAKRNRRQ